MGLMVPGTDRARRPCRERAPLAAVFRDTTRSETERLLATDILADYAADQPQMLADLLMDADAQQFAVLFPELREHGERAGLAPGFTVADEAARLAELRTSGPLREDDDESGDAGIRE